MKYFPLLLPVLLLQLHSDELDREFRRKSCEHLIEQMKAPVFNEGQLNDDAIRRRVHILYFVLAGIEGNAIYKLRNADDNRVFLSKDGRRTAVYGKDGKLINEPMNRGRRYYCHPFQDPFGHFVLDTVPWIESGASPEDPTTATERLDAFTRDLAQAVNAVATYPLPEFPKEYDVLEPERSITIAMFLHWGTKNPKTDLLLLEQVDPKMMDKTVNEWVREIALEMRKSLLIENVPQE